jgi:hypothetical protein
VIQPDLEINRRHVAALLIPLQEAVCEPLRAVLWRNSGKFWQHIETDGQVISAGGRNLSTS